jgi:hypothetical protein
MGRDRSLNVGRGTSSTLPSHAESIGASKLYGRGYVSRWLDHSGGGNGQFALHHQLLFILDED